VDIPNTRINTIDQIETALRILESQGYDTSSIWAEHNAWLLTLDQQQPTERDHAWARRAPAPSTIDELPEQLTAAKCHAGRQFTLSPGQRDVLRTRFGLTPTKVVEVVNVAVYPNDATLMWSVTLRSAEHVDPRRRKHVLNEVVLVPVSEFFEQAAARDKEREEQAAEQAEKTGKPTRVKSVTSLALAYLT
jgi:hypothetical protein